MSFVSPSPQDPAKRAQFRVAPLGGGTQPRECARGDKPSRGWGARQTENGSQSEAITIGETLRSPAGLSAFAIHLICILARKASPRRAGARFGSAHARNYRAASIAKSSPENAPVPTKRYTQYSKPCLNEEKHNWIESDSMNQQQFFTFVTR